MSRFGAGLLATVPERVRELSPTGVFVAADRRVVELHGLPLDGPHLLLDGAEDQKTLESFRALIDALVDCRLDRDGLVVAFGGGVVLDLAGFAAATYLRGVRWLSVPTTLLAQVDAAHGGKTGVDHPAAKNLIGAFHPPVDVLVDPDLLRTLPAREMRFGLAEVVKHGILEGPELLARAGRDDPRDFVEEAARVKLRIVEKDPKEQGERRLLNLGHTIGHALERASKYELHHGEAVAIGLWAACRLAEEHCGFRESATVRDALHRCGLPTHAPIAEEADVMAALEHDKKRRGGTLRWVLPQALGDVRVFEDVPEELVARAIRDVT